MNRKMMLLQLALAGSVFAQTLAVPERAPAIGPNHKLACAAGTRQIGGPKSDLGAYACLKSTVDHLRIFHGPMISFDDGGHVVAVGQMEEGSRSGTWKYFDASGVQTGATDFRQGDYHGRRVEFLPNGKLKFEENWVMGKRQGPQKKFDAAGLVTITEYRDDRPVTK